MIQENTFENARLKIDDLMIKYSQLKSDPANRARAKRIRDEAWIALVPPQPFGAKLLNEIRAKLKSTFYLDEEDVLNEFIIEQIEKYDASVCDSFTKWIQGETLWHWISNHVDRKLQKEVKPSLPQSEGEEDEPTFAELQPSTDAPTETQVESKQFVEKTVDLLCSMVLFMKRTPSKANNPVRLEYTQCFATDTLTYLCKDESLRGLDINEKEAFEAMEMGMLDFIMEQNCRSFDEIHGTALKTYKGAGVSDQPERLDLPLKNPVYLTYLPTVFQKKVSDSVLSQQKARYKDLLQDVLRGVRGLDEAYSSQ